MDKKEKERERKRAWYEANKARLKEQRAAKESNLTVNESSNTDEFDKIRSRAHHPITILLVFYALVCVTSSMLLVYFSVQILGNNLIGWTSSVLLEIGIVTLSVLKPAKKAEYWGIKILFVIFTSISFIILWAGSMGSANKLVSLKMDLAHQLIENVKNTPKDHTSKKLDALKTAKNALDPINTTENHDPDIASKLSKMLIRLALMIENLLFAHLFYRLVTKIYA